MRKTGASLLLPPEATANFSLGKERRSENMAQWLTTHLPSTDEPLYLIPVQWKSNTKTHNNHGIFLCGNLYFYSNPYFKVGEKPIKCYLKKILPLSVEDTSSFLTPVPKPFRSSGYFLSHGPVSLLTYRAGVDRLIGHTLGITLPLARELTNRLFCL